jgi:hypothetical protein
LYVFLLPLLDRPKRQAFLLAVSHPPQLASAQAVTILGRSQPCIRSSSWTVDRNQLPLF